MFTDCPPGPGERENRHESSSGGITTPRTLTAKLSLTAHRPLTETLTNSSLALNYARNSEISSTRVARLESDAAPILTVPALCGVAGLCGIRVGFDGVGQPGRSYPDQEARAGLAQPPSFEVLEPVMVSAFS